MKTIKTEGGVKALAKAWFEGWEGWSYAPVQNGLGVHGIPDRVGCVPMLITQDMVGKKVGIFVSVECKAPGRRGQAHRGMSKHQQLVMDAIYDARGRSIVCDGPDDLIRLENNTLWLRS